MKKVFLAHGFNSSPNSSWLPWLMGELSKKGIYACSLPMPNPQAPQFSDWIKEIQRHVQKDSADEVYLVGYSLGAAAILNYLQAPSSKGRNLLGAVLVSGRCEKSNNQLTENFYRDFDFKTIRSQVKKFSIIHGDNDERVPVANAYKLATYLDQEPIIIKGGGHLNGSAGWRTLPQALEALEKMME